MTKTIIIRTLAELNELSEYIKDKQYIAFDTETTGVDKDAEIIGFSICADVSAAYYVILAYWDVTQQKLIYLETNGKKTDFFNSLIGKDLIMHNSVFDCQVVFNTTNVDLMPSVHTDTMILGHILNENRSNGLKELGVSLFGEDVRKEQIEMKESVVANGGVLTKHKYELYKANAELIAKYGAKDALLTWNVFNVFIPELYNEELDHFFYIDESMPLLRGPTYELNTTGLRIDHERLQKLKLELETECMELKSFIYKEIDSYVKNKYPGTGKTNVFNIGASKQLAWLLYDKLGNDFNVLTDSGKEVCKALSSKLPYTAKARRDFIFVCKASKDRIYQEATFNPKTKKMGRPKKVLDYWNYLACGKESLSKYSKKYKWVEKLLEYAKSLKLLNTYVEGIQSRMKYNTIRPSFLQHGTTSGRYSSRNPNFQNLPRDDKRIKSCIIARPGKVFVGADYSQLEPRVFASLAQDEKLLKSFSSNEDFYSVIGIEVFDKYGAKPIKDGHPEAFGIKYKRLRDIAKVVALSSTYGTTAPKMAPTIGQSIEEAQEVIDSYFEKFPSVKKFMLDSHKLAIANGVVHNLYGRPRRMPKAKDIPQIYGNTPHAKLPYEARNILNLAINHRVQSTGASIMNRAAIACYRTFKELSKIDKVFNEVKIVLQVHDELILEGPEAIADIMAQVLKQSMEQTVSLPGVKLVAEPKIGKTLTDLK